MIIISDPFLVPPEVLFSLQPSGFPPHRLDLKKNAPVIVIRNLNQKAGVCNGTRGTVQHCYNHVVIIKLTRFIYTKRNHLK